MPKTAIVTGITGQDGAYMSSHLLSLGYRVYGGVRRTSSINFWRIEELGIADHPEFNLLDLDLTDPGNAVRAMQQVRPDEVYNLAAQSFVEVSFRQPALTTQVNALGALHLLEAIRLLDLPTRFYQASTSELYGKVQSVPQNEDTPFYPRSPYSVAKLYGHWITINYRESYNLFAACGILFNHESPLRGKNFVTRKITDGVARIQAGQLDCIELGNLDAKRDWGYTGDYIQGMHAMMQTEEPGDFVLATGRAQSVRDFAGLAFKAANVELEWHGEGLEETAIDRSSGKTVVRVNSAFYRPAEVDLLLGDASRARKELGWESVTTLEQIAERMVEADIRRIRSGASF